MELKQIKELMTAMERAGLKKISIKEKDGFELMLERQDEAATHVQVPHHYSPPTYHPPMQAKEMHSHPVVHHKGPHEEKKDEKVEGRFVTSPMVGTYYTAPSPEDPAFVKVGDKVDENTVVCIIEAMKVMNEVKAGVSGTVAEICVNNGQAVEFGTKILRVV